MTEEEFYGDALGSLKLAEGRLVELMKTSPAAEKQTDGFRMIQHVTSRIKTPESMGRKLRLRGLSVNSDSALHGVNDALGVRVICSFIDDVYQVAGWLDSCPWLRVKRVKDYISYPKPNGYRGYHMIVELTDGPGAGVTAELQLRTIALDFWASLEHQMKYKKEIRHEALVQNELKRCADEIASVDLSMQTIRDLLRDSM